MNRVFASLAVPNYRRYAIGIGISNIGLWMSRTAQSWLVLMVLTRHDAQALGLVTGLQFLPSLLFSAYGGALADRFDKRKLMLGTQSVMGLNALILGVLVIGGHGALWQVYLAALIEGTASAIDAPARQSFVSEMVPDAQLGNAIGLNSASFNAARLIGPGAAGLLIAWVGTGWVFLINAASYVAILLALIRLDREGLVPSPRSRGNGGVLEGLGYVRSRPDIVLLLVVIFMFGTFGMNYQMTNVLMATEVFGQGAQQYGLLGSVMAIGSLSGALLAAQRKRARLRHLLVALGVFTVANGLCAMAPSFWLFAILLVPVGLAAVGVMVTANTLVQTRVAASVRGRVMSLYMMLFFGGTPLGAPVIGWIGEHWGARWTLGASAVLLGLTFAGAIVHVAHLESMRIRLRAGRPWLVLQRGSARQEAPQKAL